VTKFTLKEIALAGLIAALYTVLGLAFLPISIYIWQVRVAEALTVLPFVTRAAIPGLFVGCLAVNAFGGMGWQDIVFGPLITLVAAILTHRASGISHRTTAVALAPLPPVLLNAFGVSLYLAPILGMNYWFAVQMIALGQAVACYVLGIPLILLLRNRIASLVRR